MQIKSNNNAIKLNSYICLVFYKNVFNAIEKQNKLFVNKVVDSMQWLNEIT